MSVCSVLLVLLEYKSINLYWQQAYHCDFPAKKFIESSVLLQYGDKLTEGAIAVKISWLEKIGQLNQSVIGYFNENLFAPLRLRDKDEAIPPAKESPKHPVNATSQDNKEPTDTSTHGIVLTKTDKVLFVGDSLMQGVAPHIRNTLHKEYNIVGIDLSKQSTGLAYIGSFNWLKRVAAAFKENSNIKLMVVFLGPNDPWDMPSSLGKGAPYLKFKSEEWEKVYRSRIKEMLNIAHSNSAKVIWLSPPNMKRAKLNDGMIYLDKLFLDEVNATYGYYVATSTLLGCYNDRFSSFADIDGKKIKVRIDDGVHFTTVGQKLIADRVLSLVQVK